MRNQLGVGIQESRRLACGTVYRQPQLGANGGVLSTATRWDTGRRTVRVGDVVVHQCRSEHRDPVTGMPMPDPATGRFVYRPVESFDPPGDLDEHEGDGQRPGAGSDRYAGSPEAGAGRGNDEVGSQVHGKQQRPAGWRVFCGPRANAWLHRDVVVTKEGVSERPSLHPVTIVQARYNGTYEGAPWLCFPLEVHQLAEVEQWRRWDGDETECQAFWRTAQINEFLIGRGDSPTAAYDDLIDQACAHAGVDRAALTKEPAR